MADIQARAAETTCLEFGDNRRLIDLCGPHDSHLTAIEAGAGVAISRRGNVLELHGEAEARSQAETLLSALADRIGAGEPIEIADVEAAIRFSGGSVHRRRSQPLLAPDALEIRTEKKVVKPRTHGQTAYMRALFDHELVFGIGPAGTGKTYLAVAMGVAMLADRRVDRLVLSRPAVEAGERLGFLPGDMKEKVDPYLRPLYDAIYDLWPGGRRIEKLMDEGRVEVAPLAFMRGRTLRDAFIVLDEAQNATAMQMKMFLTRLGENARMVVTGDPSQVDLPPGRRSGLEDAVSALDHVDGVAICAMNAADVVRHPLVARIVRAYDDRDQRLARDRNGE